MGNGEIILAVDDQGVATYIKIANASFDNEKYTQERIEPGVVSMVDSKAEKSR